MKDSRSKTDFTIEGFVLAGGASSRMGRDKSRLRLGEGSLLQKATETLLSVCRPVRIAGRKTGLTTSSGEAVAAVPDIKITDAKSAMIGLHTALASADSEWVLVLACDLPFVPRSLLEIIVLSALAADAELVIPMQPDDRLQPLCAAYKRRECLAAVEVLLAADKRRLQNISDLVRTRCVKFAEYSGLPGAENFFLNVNTPGDLRRAAELAGPQAASGPVREASAGERPR